MTRKTQQQPRLSPEIIAVFGQREGVGATTTAINLSLGLAAAGHSVLLVDLDPKRSASRAMGYEGQDRGGSESAITEAKLTREMIGATKITEIYLAPAGEAMGALEDSLATMEDGHTRLLQALASLPSLSIDFDHVVLDCPPSFNPFTRNALVAAHRVLLPLACERKLLDNLPDLLKAVTRLRAGLPQPLYGLYLLIGAHSSTESDQKLLTHVRQDFGRMTLMTEIPFDDSLAGEPLPEQPVLMQSTTTPISQAYLELATEWLTLGELGDQPDGTWLFRTRQERMGYYRETMLKGIEGWRIDPLSRLYDPDKAMRHQDAEALETLFAATQRPNVLARLLRPTPKALAILALIVLAVPAVLLLRAWIADPQHRIEMGARLIGSEQYWQAGSWLLAQSDETAYRELLLAARLVAENREQLMLCGEQASRDGTTSCTIDLPSGNEQ
ncbi:AAA family ATPase [Thiorhodococcus fuscus]|uniref:AAA family ATPase n=1 Tax=Thiorhodococcus fuscus TaxID=527200 RepID=A0ABW4YDJ4_9GAMM